MKCDLLKRWHLKNVQNHRTKQNLNAQTVQSEQTIWFISFNVITKNPMMMKRDLPRCWQSRVGCGPSGRCGRDSGQSDEATRQMGQHRPQTDGPHSSAK